MRMVPNPDREERKKLKNFPSYPTWWKSKQTSTRSTWNAGQSERVPAGELGEGSGSGEEKQQSRPHKLPLPYDASSRKKERDFVGNCRDLVLNLDINIILCWVIPPDFILYVISNWVMLLLNRKKEQNDSNKWHTLWDFTCWMLQVHRTHSAVMFCMYKKVKIWQC